MAGRSKKKTTMAKLDRERRLAERRVEKQARKDVRKQASGREDGAAGDAPAGAAHTTGTPPVTRIVSPLT